MRSKKRHSLAILPLLIYMISCFCNTSVYAAEAVSVSIPVHCSAKNSTETFTYQLTAESVDYQTIQNTSLSLKDGGEDAFVIRYTYPGTYHYTASQNKGLDAKTTYDTTVYTVDVYVTEDNQGVMAAEPVVYLKGSTEKKDKLSFINQKDNPETPKGTKPNPSPSSNKGGKLNNAKSVDTGDSSNMYFYAILGGISVVVLIVLIVMKRRKERTEK